MTFHELTLAVLQSNPTWDFPYALGYASGQCDRDASRPREHQLSDHDDYALGYHRGYAQPHP